MRPCRLITAYSMPLRVRDNQHSAARPFRIVGGPQKPRLAVQIIENFALVPNVIARGQNIQAQRQQFLRDARRDPEAARRILRIGDRQVDVVGLDDVLQMVDDDSPAR